MDKKQELSIYPLVIAELRKILRQQRMTFTKLSQVTGVPESTLKKWFSSKDGSLNKVTVLCRAVGLSLPEVLQRISHQQVETFRLSERQQTEFSKDWISFSLYWYLVYERETKSDIEKRLGIPSKSIEKYLLRLDRLGLIKYGPKDRVSVPRARPVRWKAEGPFFKRVFDGWAKKVLNDSFNSKASIESDLILQYFQLSEESLSELKQDIRALEEKYARRTVHALAVQTKPLKRIRFLLAYAEGSFIP